MLLVYKSVLITSPIGFDIAFTNVEYTLKQRWDSIVSTLFSRCFNFGHQRCIKVVQPWIFDAGFCFISNGESTLFQLWSTELKQCWSDVETTLMRRWNVGCQNLLKITYSVKNGYCSLSSNDPQCLFNLYTIANLSTVACKFCKVFFLYFALF